MQTISQFSTLNADGSDINNPEFNKAGQNEQRAIKDAGQALQIARTLEKSDDGRDWMRARVMAAYNGNTPYDPDDLLSAAQSYRFNISFGFMEGAIGRAVVPYNELTLDTQYIANIEGDLSEEKLTAMRDELAEIIKQWGRWPKFISRLIQDLVLNGYNSALFPTKFNPWPIFVPQKEGYVHELTPNEVRDVELYVWKKAYMIHELYNNISDAEAATKAGWNVDNVRVALENATPADLFQRNVSGGWTTIESALRASTLYSSIVGGKQINAFHVFATELDGRVTHYVVFSPKTPDDPNKPAVTELFKKLDQFDSMDDILVYFDLEAGDGHWHGSKGLGRRAFNTHMTQDKLRCGLLDQAFTSGLTILQMGDQNAQEDFNLTVAGPFAVIPPGVNISNTAIPTLSNTSFQMDALISATAEQRFGDLVPNIGSTYTKKDKTATQSQIDSNRSQLVTKGNLQRFLDPLGKMMSLMVKRLLIEGSPNAYAQRFQEALKKRGFTPEDFKKIRGAKSTGKIDTVLGTEQQAMSVVFQEFRGDPQVNQLELKRRRLASIVGPKEVEGLLIEDTDPTLKIEAARAQMEEIASMLQGIGVPVSPRDNHEVHFPVGAEWIKNQMNQQEHGQPGASQEVLELVFGHLQRHIDAMALDEMQKDLMKQFQAQMKQLLSEFHRLATTPKKNTFTPPLPQGNSVAQ